MDCADFLSRLDRLSEVPAPVLAAFREEAAELLEVSKAEAPHEDGELEDSGHLEDTSEGVDVVFDAPYALYQHERLDLYHPTGGAKYLERPLLERQDATIDRLQEVLNKEL